MNVLAMGAILLKVSSMHGKIRMKFIITSSKNIGCDVSLAGTAMDLRRCFNK